MLSTGSHILSYRHSSVTPCLLMHRAWISGGCCDNIIGVWYGVICAAVAKMELSSLGVGVAVGLEGCRFLEPWPAKTRLALEILNIVHARPRNCSNVAATRTRNDLGCAAFLLGVAWNPRVSAAATIPTLIGPGAEPHTPSGRVTHPIANHGTLLTAKSAHSLYKPCKFHIPSIRPAVVLKSQTCIS